MDNEFPYDFNRNGLLQVLDSKESKVIEATKASDKPKPPLTTC